MDLDDLTHTITITVDGNYPHGKKQHSQVIVSGDGSIDHMTDAFRSALVASGFAMDTAKRIGFMDDLSDMDVGDAT